jgi:hypothetical protein
MRRSHAAHPAHALVKPLQDCTYTAFISYAHADDTASLDWVSHFCRELQRVLPAVARIPRLPPLHQSGLNGPVAGVLGDELKANVAASFAMLIVVGENYVHSAWCLRELEYFRELFGERGFRERLFIVAMSEPAALALANKPAWRALMPEGEQLWLGFFQDEDRRLPLDVYAGEGLVSPAFARPFRRLLDEFAARLKADAAQGLPLPPLKPAPSPGAAPARSGAPAPAAPPGQAAPGAPADTAAVLVGWCAPGSAAAAAAAAQALAAAGLRVRTLGPELLASDFAEFAGAAALVLLADEQPLMAAAAVPGGHLQMQREAWQRRGGEAAALWLLDTRATPGVATPATEWAAAQGLTLSTLPALLQRLQPAPPPPAAAPAASPVRIYIESNRHERTLWRALGEQVQAQWQAVCAELAPGRQPPLVLRPRGLPVDELDAYPTLDDADGVVLLWGRKTSDALVAQINKVEAKLPGGADTAPGIVAYLMPPQHSTEPLPAWGWQVLRFDAADEARVDVVADEQGELRRFLVDVFERHRARHGGRS